MLSLGQAQEIVTSGLAFARDQSYPPMTVAVLDAGGQLIAFAREDGSSLLREKISRGKALGSLNMGVGSRALASRAADNPGFIAAVTALAAGNLVPVAGGVLLKDSGGQVLGAVGVSGHHPDADEACALAGIAAARLIADTGS
jgi:uncharacterized protein GlcG (DUF336 family)